MGAILSSIKALMAELSNLPSYTRMGSSYVLKITRAGTSFACMEHLPSLRGSGHPRPVASWAVEGTHLSNQGCVKGVGKVIVCPQAASSRLVGLEGRVLGILEDCQHCGILLLVLLHLIGQPCPSQGCTSGAQIWHQRTRSSHKSDPSTDSRSTAPLQPFLAPCWEDQMPSQRRTQFLWHPEGPHNQLEPRRPHF